MPYATHYTQTVGYGDVAFQHQSTKIFLIFFIILSTAVLGLAINNIYAVIQNRKVLNERRSLLKLQRRLHFLADLNDGRGVGRFEFVLTILEHIGTLDHDKDIAPWLKVGSIYKVVCTMEVAVEVAELKTICIQSIYSTTLVIVADCIVYCWLLRSSSSWTPTRAVSSASR